jgi:hypothetical protein
MSNNITYMDCWHFVAPLIPVDTDYTMDIYIMVFNALKEAEKNGLQRRKGEKRMAKVIVTVFFVILVSLFCVLAATWLVWGILIIDKEVIELWREVKE